MDLPRIGAAVKARRDTLKLSIRQAATMAEIGPSTWADLERGLHPPTTGTQRAVAGVLGWELQWFDALVEGRRPAYLLINGGRPVVIPANPDDDTWAITGTVTVTPEALALLDARVTTLEGHDVEALHQQVVALAKEVRRLQRQLGKLGAASVQEARQARRRAAGSPE